MVRIFSLVFAVMCLTLSGCKNKEALTDPVCDIAKKSLEGAATGIASALACSNVDAVKATLTKPVEDLQLCKDNSAQGVVGDLVCGQVSKFVMQMGLASLPTEWGCTGGNLGTEAEKALLDACLKVVTF